MRVATLELPGPELPRAHQLGSDALALLLVGAAYFILARLGLGLASINPSATPIWPPTGLAIAATLIWGYRVAPAIFLAAFLVNQLTAGSMSTSLAIALGNTLEAVITGCLVRYWADGKQVFDTPIGIVKFGLVSLPATLVSATIGVSSLTLAGYAEANNFVSIWLTWWLGDLAGALVMTPVVVLWAKSEPASFTAPQITRTGLTYLAAIASGAIAFSPLFQGTTLDNAVVWIVILPLLWASLRQGPRDTATVTFIISAFVVWCTETQCGPFGKPSLNDSFILSLAFMISAAVLSLALSADVAMRQALSLALSTELAARHRIENRRRQLTLESEVLWQATVQVAAGGSFEDLLRGCLKSVCRVTGWPVGHVYLPDNVSAPHRLLPSPVWHFERQELAPLAQETAGVVLAFGQGVPGKVWASGKSVCIRKISETANQPRKPILLKHGLHSAYGFPLYAEGKLQAVLEFFSTTSQSPDKHLLCIVEGIGEQLGRVLERQRAQKQTKALEEALNALSSAVYLTDRHGQIVYMNRTAERQVSVSNAIRVENNRLVPVDRIARLAFVRAIDHAAADNTDLRTSAFILALPEPDNPGLIAAIHPLAHRERQSLDGAMTAMAAIFVQDPIEMGPSSGEAFAKLHGLTASELRVLLTMVPGRSIKQVAELLGIGETTAKTHLQHIYSKTGTSKQTELMHLFMSSTPPVKAA